MEYSKRDTSGLKWLSGKDVEKGTRIKITGEMEQRESRFGGTQDVARVVVSGEGEFNCNFNATSLNALIDAYGTESTNWIDKIVIAHPEPTTIAGKRVTALYLAPEGYTLTEDDQNRLIIAKLDDGVPGRGRPADTEEEDEFATQDDDEDEIDVKNIPF